MYIYKIELSQDDIFIGSTSRSIAKKRWGHMISGKNYFTSCSLYNRMRILDICPTTLNLEIIEEISNGGENKRTKITKLLEEVLQLINEL